MQLKLWDNTDYLQWTKDNKELFTEAEYQEAIAFYETDTFTSIYGIVIDGRYWSPYFLPTETDPDAYKSEYGYFDRNTVFDKNLYICGGENEDADYEEYYGDNPTTLEGISLLMERLEQHGVTTAVCEIYENSNHYEFIPDMFRTFFLKYYQ